MAGTPAPARAAKMHDFCLTIPYGALLMLGGLAGFLAKGATVAVAVSPRRDPQSADACSSASTLAGSVPSLVAGGGSGLLLCLLAVLSLKAWKTGARGASAPYTVASAALAAGLTAMMTKRYLASGAVFPPGVFAVLSGAMLLFYIYNLAAGGNPMPKKAD